MLHNSAISAACNIFGRVRLAAWRELDLAREIKKNAKLFNIGMILLSEKEASRKQNRQDYFFISFIFLISNYNSEKQKRNGLIFRFLYF